MRYPSIPAHLFHPYPQPLSLARRSYFPDIQSDPEAALYLAKAVADDLQKRVHQLHAELEQARQDSATQLDR